MVRITMRKVQETKLSEVFTLYLTSAAARGVKDKTLRTDEQDFHAISKRLDVDSNISQITSKDLDKMILKMREEGLSDSSINSDLGGIRNPVTGQPENSKAYNRRKSQDWKKELPNPAIVLFKGASALPEW